MSNNTITESDWLDTFHAWKVLDDLLRAESYAQIIDALKQLTPQIGARLDKVISKLQYFAENNTITSDEWSATYDAWKVLDDLLCAESCAQMIEALQEVTPEIRDRLDNVVSKLQDFVEASAEGP